ncbi:MAG: NAD(P)/FAD-dependent oxidoreductase, partial [Betaproteobacteria bacterium]
MAAEVLSNAGVQVDVYDAMPSLSRKFLLAGKGGLNLTHTDPAPRFLSHYGVREESIEPLLRGFGPEQLREWVHGL